MSRPCCSASRAYSYPEKFFPVILGGDLETIALPTGGLSQRPLKVGSGLGDFSFVLTHFESPNPLIPAKIFLDIYITVCLVK
jgi:hypothetical protein